MNDLILFQFEKQFANDLQCIPMIVRFKLDKAGIKLSIKQWHHFQFEDRSQLATLPCTSITQINNYKIFLTKLISEKTDEQPVVIAAEIHPEWLNINTVPEQVIMQAIGVGIKPPLVEMWSKLNDLQRFTLYKLSRAGHGNQNFLPAMREFSLMQPKGGQISPRQSREFTID